MLRKCISIILLLFIVFGLVGCTADKPNAGAPEGVKMEPGTYTASAYGFMAIEPLSVSVTVDETKILDIEIDHGRESVPMINAINKLLVPRMLEHQSVAVDAITGATASSKAVLQAITEALKEALVAGGSDPSAISAFQKPEPKVTDSKEIDVEVLVIGMGGSGCAAAMSAAEQMHKTDPDNVSVLAIDKAGKLAVLRFCGEPMAVNPPRFKEQFNNGNDYMDGEALFQCLDRVYRR